MMICLLRNNVTQLYQRFKTESEADNQSFVCSLCCKTIPKKSVLVNKDSYGKELDEPFYINIIRGSEQENGYFHYGCLSLRGEMDRYRNSDFDNMSLNDDMKPFVEYLKNWDFSKSGAFVTSSCGTGKTHALVSFFKSLGNRKDFNTVMFCTLQDLVSDVRKEMLQDSEKTIDMAIRCGCLIIDDFGVEKQTEWVSDVLYRIINNRYNNNLPVFVSTNLSIQEVKEFFGDRILSRFYEMCQFFTFKSNDFRRLKK